MDEPWRILVTGSREFSDVRLVRRWLRWVQRKCGPRGMELLVGDADGLDAIALMLATCELKCPVTKLDAEDYGRWPACGPIRNQALVDLRPVLALGFLIRGLKQKGTPDCVNRALRAGVYTRLVYQRRA